MWFFNFLRKPKQELGGMDLLLSQFRFEGGTGGKEDPIRIVPLNRETAMMALRGPLAEVLAPKDTPLSDSPAFRFAYARGLILRLLKEGFLEKRYGPQGEAWEYGMHITQDNNVEIQQVIRADGTEASFYFDFSSLTD